MAKLVRPALLFPISFILAWLFDFLFWGKAVGVSFPVFILLLVAAGFWLARRSKLKPARESLWLILAIILLSLVSVLRAEPFSLLTSRLLIVSLLGLLALSFLGGRWVSYGFADHVVNLSTLIPRGLRLLRDTEEGNARKNGQPSIFRSLAPVARGLILALPLLFFLSLLLSSADAFFANWLGDLFLNFEKVPEYVLRGLIILGLTYCLAAAYFYAFARSRDTTLLADGKPVVAPILGFGEAATMLASVNLLFAIFVAVQFRYFFGGLANIVESPAGLTFAEYARRGFFELVLVAITALVFFVLLSGLTRRQAGSQQTWFSGLGIALFLLVAVILGSAFQRLLLLEQAYGFSRLRTYPHMFMIWLGILLLAVVVLEMLGRRRGFALAVLLAVVGFTLSLSLVNVDAFIARTNIERETLAGELDYLYLASLSDDAVPDLVEAYQQAMGSGNTELSDQIAIALACHFAETAQNGSSSWQSWTWSRKVAREQWTRLRATPNFPEVQDAGVADRISYSVIINGDEVGCWGPILDADFP